jgi:hypothetical protein
VIAVERRGRLGNQMFQFAFGLAASRLLSTDFVMADDELHRVFSLGRFSAPGRRAVRALRYRLRRTLSPFPVVKIDRAGEADPEAVLCTLEDGTLYAGYFQSERFFAHASEEVHAAFTVRPELQAAFRSKYGPLLERPYICCHVRRTDYLTWLDGVALPVSYYRECLERAGNAGSVPVVFVGDDLEEVRSEFGGLEHVRFEANTEAVDHLLVTHADTVIASNSSFAWWGAWLNARPVKTVLAPRHWLGFKEGHELPPGVIPPDWTQVPVR